MLCSSASSSQTNRAALVYLMSGWCRCFRKQDRVEETVDDSFVLQVDHQLDAANKTHAPAASTPRGSAGVEEKANADIKALEARTSQTEIARKEAEAQVIELREAIVAKDAAHEVAIKQERASWSRLQVKLNDALQELDQAKAVPQEQSGEAAIQLEREQAAQDRQELEVRLQGALQELQVAKAAQEAILKETKEEIDELRLHCVASFTVNQERERAEKVQQELHFKLNDAVYQLEQAKATQQEQAKATQQEVAKATQQAQSEILEVRKAVAAKDALLASFTAHAMRAHEATIKQERGRAAKDRQDLEVKLKDALKELEESRQSQ